MYTYIGKEKNIHSIYFFEVRGGIGGVVFGKKKQKTQSVRGY